MCHYGATDKWYGDLAEVLKIGCPSIDRLPYATPWQFTVIWVAGSWSFTDFVRLRRTYGLSIVSIDDVIMTLTAAIRLLKEPAPATYVLRRQTDA